MASKQKLGATRKINKPRQLANWKQWIQYASVIVVLLLVIGGGAYLQDDSTLPILHVTVEGQFKHAKKAALVKAVSPFVRGSFVNVDVASIRRAGQALPWIKQLQVHRVWPDTLNLTVEEQQAIAFWNDNGLVNTDGAVFTPAKSTFPSGLIQLNGPDGTSELMVRRLIDIQQQVAALGLRVKKLDMDKRRAWGVEFKDGMRLVLGRANSDVRLQRFVKMFSGGLQRFKPLISVVDMRYTNGLSVIWKAGDKPDFNGTV